MKKSKSSIRKIALSIAVASAMACCGAAVMLTGCKNDNTPPAGSEQSLPVTVTIGQTSNGTVTADKSNYVSGDTVTLTITPETGYELGYIKIGETDKTASVRNGVLVLNNVTENITVTAVFNARTAATASATVKENKGGTASLSATNAYIGDTVTLTLTPEAGYDVISVKVNGSEKVGDLNGGKTLSISLSEATTSVEVEFYAIPISANVVFNSEYGIAAITDAKPTYVMGDTIEVTLTPNDKCKVVSVLVNGEENLDQVENNKLTVTVSEVGNVNVTVVFDLIPVACEFGVTATRFGAAYDVNGAEVLFEHKTMDRTYKTSINSDGKINTELVLGTYTMTVAGCIPVEVEVTENGVENEKQVVYQIFNENNLSGTVDVTQPNKVTLQSAYAWITSADSFTGDVIFTTNLKHSSAATYFAVGFIGASQNFMLAITSEGNAEKLHFKKYGDVLFGGAQFVYDSEYSVTLSSDEQTAFTGSDGLTLKVVRRNNVLCLIVGNGTIERLLESWDVEDYAGQSMQFGMCTFGGTEYSFTVSASNDADEIEELLASTVTVASGIENGTISLERQDGKYYLGETATITVTPKQSDNENTVYILKSLTVGTTDVTDKVANGVCKVKVTDKALQITAEFEQVTYASISVNVSGLKYGATQTIDKVWLSSSNYARTPHDVVDGTLSVNRLIEGEYTIEANGYLPAKVNVTTTQTSYTDITLAYQIFNENHKDGNVDVSTANSVTLNSAYAWITSKDAFEGDVMFTTTLKQTNAINYFSLCFKGTNGAKDTILTLTAEANNSASIKLTGFGENGLWANGVNVIDKDVPVALDTAEQAAFPNGLTLKVVRKGNVLCLFAGSNDKLLKSWDISDLAGQSVEFGMCTFGNSAYTFPVTVTQKAEEINAVVGSTVSANVQGTVGGTVTLDKTDGHYNIGERATVTIATPSDADENTVYTVKTFTVNGEDKKADITAASGGFAFEFTVTEKTVNIVIELERTEYADLSVNISGLKYGAEQEITSVTLKNAAAGYEEVKSLTGGTLTVQKLIPGEYTVEVAGYFPATITVAKDATYNAVTLNWQIFDAVKDGTVNLDTMKDGYLAMGGYGFLTNKESISGDFVFTTKIKHTNVADKRTYFSVCFMNSNKFITVAANGGNDYDKINFIPFGDAMWLGSSCLHGWDAVNIRAEETAEYRSDGATLKLVKHGTKLYLFIGHGSGNDYTDRLIKIWDLTAITDGVDYSTEPVQFGVCNLSDVSMNIPVAIDTTTTAVEALVGNKNLNIGITFNKYGTAQTVTSVKLNDTAYQLTDGRLVANDLPMGFYTITAEGYAPCSLNLLSNDNVVMQYELIGTVKGGTVDQSNLSNGYVTASSWGGATFKEAISGDFVYTVGLKSADNKLYGSLCFMDGGGNTMMSFGVEGNTIDKIYAYKAGDGALWTAGFLSDVRPYELNTDEQAALVAGSLCVKLVKNANNLYVFISHNGTDRYVDTFDITAHANKSVEFGLYNISGSSVNMVLSLDTTQAAVDAMVAKVTA